MLLSSTAADVSSAYLPSSFFAQVREQLLTARDRLSGGNNALIIDGKALGYALADSARARKRHNVRVSRTPLPAV